MRKPRGGGKKLWQLYFLVHTPQSHTPQSHTPQSLRDSSPKSGEQLSKKSPLGLLVVRGWGAAFEKISPRSLGGEREGRVELK